MHINDHYQRVGGAETILFSTLDALEDKGITNVVVHQYPTDVVTDRRTVYQVPGLSNPNSSQSSIVSDALRKILGEEKPDLIHIYDIASPEVSEISPHYAPTIQSVYNHILYCPGGAKYLPFLGRICERPFGMGCLVAAFLTHCNSVRPRALVSSYRRCQRMAKNNRALVFLALSQYQADRLVQNGYPSEVVKILPPFTDLPPLEALPGKCLDDHALLFVGRVVPQKGLDVLLKSLRYINSPFRLIVDGEGHDMDTVRAVVHELGLGDRVEFAGWAPRDRHLAFYRQASVVVVPSVWPEPFGLVGIEAMSYGKPVVAFRVGGIPEWLEDGVTGFLISPNDHKEMAQKIDYLLENPDRAREMGMRGRKKVELEFNEEKHVTRLLQIYNEVIDGWIRPRGMLH